MKRLTTENLCQQRFYTNIDIVKNVSGLAGEPFIKFQIDWKREMQPNHVIPFFFGYTWNNGRWPMYLPDIRSAAYGGFGADEGSWLIEVGAGEKIFNKLIENYYRMMGVFR